MAGGRSGTCHDRDDLLDQIESMRETARRMPELTLSERTAERDAVLRFVRGTLVPHAREEERELYPAIGRQLGHPDATAPMIYDHLAIGERAAALAETDATDVARLQELLYGLYALVRVHFWKEQELYLPLIERTAVTPH